MSTVPHLHQAEERVVEIGRDCAARELLSECLLDDFHLTGEPGTGFLVGRVRAVHFVNSQAEIEGALKYLHDDLGGGDLINELCECDTRMTADILGCSINAEIGSFQ